MQELEQEWIESEVKRLRYEKPLLVDWTAHNEATLLALTELLILRRMSREAVIDYWRRNHVWPNEQEIKFEYERRYQAARKAVEAGE